MKWGLLDTKDDLWIGNDDGALIYDDDDPQFAKMGSIECRGRAYTGAEIMARIAAEMVDIQAGWGPGRTRHREFTGVTRVVDEVKLRMSTLEALKRKESGRCP